MPMQQVQTGDATGLRRLWTRIQPKCLPVNAIPRGQITPFPKDVETVLALVVLYQLVGHDEDSRAGLYRI